MTSMIFWQYPLLILRLTYLLMRHHRLKSLNTPEHIVYTIGQINLYPLGIYAVQFVTSRSRYSAGQESADFNAKH